MKLEKWRAYLKFYASFVDKKNPDDKPFMEAAVAMVVENGVHKYKRNEQDDMLRDNLSRTEARGMAAARRDIPVELAMQQALCVTRRDAEEAVA